MKLSDKIVNVILFVYHFTLQKVGENNQGVVRQQRGP